MNSNYINSKVQWIGLMPSDWNVIRLKDTFTRTNSGEVIDKSYWHSGDELLYTCQKTPMKSDFSNFPEEKRTGENDLLLTRNATPYVFVPQKNAIYSNVVQRITIKNTIDRKYIRYAVQCGAEAIAVYGDTIPSYNMEVWKNIAFPLPNLDTQEKIARILDKKCDELSKLIDNQYKQIENLKKYRLTVITEAITKGTRDIVNIKESNSEWIREINDTFKVTHIKSLFSIKKDIIGKEPDTVLSITQKGIKIKDITQNEGQMASSYANYQIVNVGDFAMNHMDLLTGGIDISKYEGVTSPDYRVFTLKDKRMNPRYFLYIFESYYKNKIFYAFGQGAANLGRWRLPAQNFNSLTIPVAPIDEQTEIVEFLDKKTAEIDKLIGIKEQKIKKLNEYKKSLIYEYVTGKKQVI